MDILTTKYGLYSPTYRTPKNNLTKPLHAFEHNSSSNKENIHNTLKRDNSSSRNEKEHLHPNRSPSMEKKLVPHSTSHLRTSKQETAHSSVSNHLTNALVFNSPRFDGGGSFFGGSQDKGSYKSKYLNKATRPSSSCKQDDKPPAQEKTMQARIDQIVEHSIANREKPRSVLTPKQNNFNIVSNLEEKASQTAVYTKIQSVIKSCTPKGREFSQTEQITIPKAAYRPSSELYKNSEKKKIGEVRLSSVDVEDMRHTPVEIERSTPKPNSSIVIEHEKRASTSKEHHAREKEHHTREKENPKIPFPKTLTINTEESQASVNYTRPSTTKHNTKPSEGRISESHSLTDAITQFKKANNLLAKSQTKAAPIYNNFIQADSKENRPYYKATSPKASAKPSIDSKSLFQSLKSTSRQSKPMFGQTEKRTSEEQPTYSLLGAKNSNSRPSTEPVSTATTTARPSSSTNPTQPVLQTSKERESSTSPTPTPQQIQSPPQPQVHPTYLRKEDPRSSKEQEKPAAKNLKDFITQVTPGMVVNSPKHQGGEDRNLSNLFPQSTKNSTSINKSLDGKLVTLSSSAIMKGSPTHASTQDKAFVMIPSTNSTSNKVQSRGFAPSGEEKSQNKPTESLGTQKSSMQTYYMTNLEKYLKTPHVGDDYFNKLYKEHFLQTFQAINFCRYLKPVDPKELSKKKVYLQKRETHKDKKTIVFDLDETLIHCNENSNMPCDIILPIKFPHGEIIEAGINVRPYAIECLEELSKMFEIVVFTASHSCYANVVLDYLDPQGKYIHHRLFRDSCVNTEEGLYVKDLRIFANRNLKDVVLVDNAVYSFGYQLDNGIPIVPFYYNKADTELKSLVPYLKSLFSVRDVREVNNRIFKLQAMLESESQEEVFQRLFPGN